MHKTITLLTLIILALGVSSCSDKTQDLPEFSKVYSATSDAESDLNYAVSLATQQNKRILMLVGGDWCIWCRSFDTFINTKKPEIGEYLHDNFVLLKVYYGRENYNQRFFSEFPRVVATPHFFVLESDGTTLLSQGSAEFEKGISYDTLKVMSFLQKWTKK
jgi:thioredoxin-related protein